MSEIFMAAATVVGSSVQQGEGSMVRHLDELGRRCARLLAALLVVALLAGTAWAQEEDEEPPVDPADLATPAGQLLGQGFQYYQQENFIGASLLFYRVMTEADASDELIFRAEYELAKTLFRLRLYFASLFYFDTIVTMGPDHPYFIPTYRWLLRLQRRIPGEPNMLERVSYYEEFFPDQIEDKYRDQMAFLIGRYHFNRGNLDGAQRFLGYVSPASRHYAPAQYLLGISHIQEYEGQAALDAFKEVLFTILDSDERDDESKEMAERAVLAMARTFYSTQEFDKAIDYYDNVPFSSTYWLDALFEEAWALFRMGEYNLALGNLHSLNSPFFDDEFYPEGMILQSVIFFRNCNFDLVRESVEEFDIAYAPILEQLDEILGSMGRDQDYYNLVVELLGEQEQDFSPQVARILNAAINSKAVQESVDYVRELDRELTTMRSADPGWLNTGLADELLTETELARSVGAGRAGEAIQIRVTRARNELFDLLNQADAILVETDLAEQAVIDEQLRGELNLEDTGLMPPPVDSEELLWHFAGEYWRDELGYYWYAVRSQCEEVGL
jgi:tetratricopeptide (TPR) repeat protein